ncbi:hypothetical protein AB6A40_003965 [Gnathostoma spinigerum]|uniref:Uncharacterized protein n=1 Tax=Gnathostoma spinigerum TaxID=75299 RepID=A0ABD6EC76_9BILA
MHHLLTTLIFLSTACYAGRLPPSDKLNETPICLDGRRPLMEFHQPVICDSKCSDGYLCQFSQHEGSVKGICCPDIEHLVELYDKEGGFGDQKFEQPQ